MNSSVEFQPRPWGFWISFGSYYDYSLQCLKKHKILVVNPEKALSNQRHLFRREILLVIHGEMTIGSRRLALGSQPYEVKLGEWHKIRNESKENLLVIFETQIGSKVNEDDIERRVEIDDDHPPHPIQRPYSQTKETAMKPPDQIRQGDVPLVEVERLPDGARPVPRDEHGRVEGRRIVGTLVNDPVTHLDGTPLPVQPALRRNDLIWIRREEVMDVWKKEQTDANP